MKEVLDGLVRHADGALLPTWPRWALYLMATLLSVGTLLVRIAIATAFAQRPLLIILVIPIIVSAILGGLGRACSPRRSSRSGATIWRFPHLAVLPRNTATTWCRGPFSSSTVFW
jgi:hypothetical protein